MGASVRHFDIPDCIYRRAKDDSRPLYVSEIAIFGPLHPAEEELVEFLAGEYSRLVPVGANLVCPLTIGGHADHRLTRQAAERSRIELWYYADYPYVSREASVLERIRREGWASTRFTVSENGLEAWQQAVGATKRKQRKSWKSRNSNSHLKRCRKCFSEDDDEDDVKMAKLECAKGKEADFGIVMQGAYAKMCKMAKVIEKMAEEKKAYMAENEELMKFKATLEGQQKEFAINETIKELSASVSLSEEVKAEMRADAESYSLENLEAWKNACKAKSFDFAIRMPPEQGTIKVGLPFSGTTKKEKSLWD